MASAEMITDDNTLEDILGAIWCAQTDLLAENPEFSRSSQLEGVIERITEKLSRCKNETRRNWFTKALEYAQQAKECHGRDAPQAVALLRKVEEYLAQGNKAHRRKSRFVVGVEGDIQGTGRPTSRP